jgi:hypothetical protein
MEPIRESDIKFFEEFRNVCNFRVDEYCISKKKRCYHNFCPFVMSRLVNRNLINSRSKNYTIAGFVGSSVCQCGSAFDISVNPKDRGPDPVVEDKEVKEKVVKNFKRKLLSKLFKPKEF